MSGPGGVGPMSSSRLTRILQEKAEALRKRRQSAEALFQEVEQRAESLATLGVTPPELTEGLERLRELAHRSDWEQLEGRARAVLDSLGLTVPAAIQGRRRHLEERAARLVADGIRLPPELLRELGSLPQAVGEASWAEMVGRLAAIEQQLQTAPVEQLTSSRARAVELARWAGLPEERLAEFERALPDAAVAAKDGHLVDALAAVRRTVEEGLPEAAELRRTTRETAEAARGTANELSLATSELEAALADDAAAPFERWPETVARVRACSDALAEQLRGRAAQSMAGLTSALKGLGEFGADAGPATRAIEAAAARLGGAGPAEVGPLLAEARRAAEEPIVAVVAGLMDEVRPRIARARRLGRNPSDVFAAMNRAREALRLKIYSEAFAASREALEKVRRLTEDVDGVRDELAQIEEMLERFGRGGFATAAFHAVLDGVRDHLERGQVGPAREALRQAVRSLGSDAVSFFFERWRALDHARSFAEERGFLPEEAARGLGEARNELDRGDLLGAVEHLAAADVDLRTAAGPYVARRVEEMESAFGDFPDEALSAATRRHLADADVNLRVKEDLVATLESLRRAEREFTTVFAARASGLVEGLEEEVRTLEAMGGASEELHRQIDQVQQIFNMGDFVNASRTSQEIRSRARSQQLVRSDEALSHAKLALVELEAVGIDLASLRGELEGAQTSAREGRTLDAYRVATRLEELAGHHRAAAQTALGRFARVDELFARQRAEGFDASALAPKVAEARAAFRTLAFDRARALLDEVEEGLGAEGARRETDRRLGEIALLLEEGNRLALPMDPFVARKEKLTTERSTAPPAATGEGARLLEEELVALLRPALEENLHALERDLDVARGAGVSLKNVSPSVAEARRRIALSVPSGAAQLLDDVRGQLVSTRGFVEQAERTGRRVREALAQAELLHVNVGALKGRSEEVERRLDAREYPRVIDLGTVVERDLLQAIHQHVSKTLAGFQAAVAQLRRRGGETSVAENLLHQARAALEEGKAVEALQLASRSEREIERVDLQRRLAQGAIGAASGSVSRARQDGLLSPQADEALAAAEAAFARSDYPTVLEHALSVYETLSVAKEGLRHAREALALAERQVAEATGLGAEAQEAAGVLAEGKEELSAGRYPAAVRLGREAAEMGRWAIERMFSAPLGELRAMLEAGRREGLTEELAALEGNVAEAEAALRASTWPKVRSLLAKADAQGRKLVASLIDRRWAEFDADARKLGAASPAESARRTALKADLERLKETRDLGEAVRRLRTETETLASRRQEETARGIGEFRDRLWVGERLGIDTTPMMQGLGEARVALESGNEADAAQRLGQASDALDEAIRSPLARRQKEVQSEVAFAEGGLHVAVEPVKARLHEAEEATAGGRLVDAARLVLQAEEELNLRKSLHRELSNLQYLLDTAIHRAEERNLDASKPRALLAESLRLRSDDYAQALEKAREALRLLREEGVVDKEPPVAWPFSRDAKDDRTP